MVPDQSFGLWSFYSMVSFSALKQRLAANWQSGITVSLVSIPLSVSLAVASQATPVMGIITAIWAGIMAAFFGGSHFNIVGPTGALSGLLAAYALTNGVLMLPMLAIVSGVFVLIAYAARLERFLVFVPASAIQGFTLGVAFIIGLNQLNFALGLSGLPPHPRFVENVLESLHHIGGASFATVGVFLVFLLALFAFVRWLPKLPGAILLSPIGILLGYASQHGWISLKLLTLGAKYPDMGAKIIDVPTFSFQASLIPAAFGVALIAILETMISAKIADGMTKTKHHKRKEMLGLGLANIASGLAGGIPATAALARTSLNIKTKATHSTSAAISSISIAIISLILLKYFAYIPLAVIAAILVFVAARMVEIEAFKRFYRYDRMGLVLAFVVAAVTIYEDPIVGLILGTAISLIVFMEKLSHGQFELIVNDEHKHMVKKIVSDEAHPTLGHPADTLVYSMKGQLAYINAESHLARFEQDLNGYKHVLLRLRELSFVDLDGVDAFDEIVELIERQGKVVMVSGVNPFVQKLLEGSKHFRTLEAKNLVFDRTTDALRSVGYQI
jgi:SulP family sulfate permease